MIPPEDSKYVLVLNGAAASCIVVPKEATKGELDAAEELQRYVEKITGARLPILTSLDDSATFSILIGRASARSGLTFPDLDRESYIIRTNGKALFIHGADDDGVFFAVCTFLERYCDVRWFWPGELGEVVPQRSTLVIPGIDVQETPAFKWRNRGPGGPLWGGKDRISKMRELGVTEKHIEEVQLWERRNKLGGMKVWGGHEWGNIVPPAKYGKKHPGYFALIDGRRDRDFEGFDGKHGAQLCTTNPDLIAIFSAYVDDFFAKHPDYDALHITPNDGGRFCECERCRALDSGKRLEKNPARPVITDRIFTFASAVASEVAKRHPDKHLMNMAYSWYIDPPERVKINDLVIPQYCLWSCYLHDNKEKKKRHYLTAKGWSQAAKSVAIYEYFINGSWPDLPRIVYAKIAESLRYLHSIGIRMYQAQAGDGFAVNGLNYYIASKLWWNVDVDVEALITEYYDKAFGAGGQSVRRFHQRLQRAWQQAVEAGGDPSCSSFATSSVHRLYPLELLHECEDDLRRAGSVVADDAIRRRIDFLEKGLRYVILTIKAVTLTKELESLGVAISSDTISDEEEVVRLDRRPEEDLEQGGSVGELTRSSLRAWEERDKYVETLKDDFVISYFWIKYNDTNRKFNPIDRLTQLSTSLPR